MTHIFQKFYLHTTYQFPGKRYSILDQNSNFYTLSNTKLLKNHTPQHPL